MLAGLAGSKHSSAKEESEAGMVSSFPLADGANERRHGSGALIINADDWGRDRLNTDRIADCVRAGAVSSVSAMMFMEDSERSARVAQEMNIDAGLHLNFTTPFSNPSNPRLKTHQEKLARYLRGHRLAQVVFHPGLVRHFEYVVVAQIDEFRKLYEYDPIRLDGHHHMHLCANVLFGRLLPEGTVVRRSFSFGAGEKNFANRSWRKIVDAMLARRHRLTDFFFALQPLRTNRLQEIVSLTSRSVVELETHPVNSDEYELLTSGGILQWCDTVKLTSFSSYFK